MASMTGQSVINIARAWTGDESHTTKTPEWYLARIMEGETETMKLAPSSRLASAGTLLTHTVQTDPAQALTLSDMYQMALAHYVAFRFYDDAGSDTENAAEAKRHFDQFLARIRGGG